MDSWKYWSGSRSHWRWNLWILLFHQCMENIWYQSTSDEINQTGSFGNAEGFEAAVPQESSSVHLGELNAGQTVNWFWRRCRHMFYNPLFEFDQTLDDQNNTLSILELLDETIGNGIYNKCIEDSDWFPIKDPFCYLHAIDHVPFLAYKYKTSIICNRVPYNEVDQRAACTTTFSWYHQELQKVNSYSIEGIKIPPPGVSCIVHHIDHFQYIKTRKKKQQVCKKSSI